MLDGVAFACDAHANCSPLPQNMLHITRPHPTPTQTLIDSTKGLAFRAQAIQFAINRKVAGEGAEARGERGERGGRGGRGGGGRGLRLLRKRRETARADRVMHFHCTQFAQALVSRSESRANRSSPDQMTGLRSRRGFRSSSSSSRANDDDDGDLDDDDELDSYTNMAGIELARVPTRPTDKAARARDAQRR